MTFYHLRDEDDWNIDPETFVPVWYQGELPYNAPSPELLGMLRWLELERVRWATSYLNGEIDDDYTRLGYPATFRPRK